MSDDYLAKLYDSLTRVERLFGLKPDRHTVHKALEFERHPDTELHGYRDANELICDLALRFSRDSHILDAGCGHGGSLISLSRQFGCSGVGISLSGEQIRVARKLAVGLPLLFKQRSFDQPPPGVFSHVICIESLTHASNLDTTYNALAKSLAPDGYLIVLEDMFKSGQILKETKPELMRFSQLWSANELNGVDEHKKAARLAGLKHVSGFDLELSGCVKKRESKALKRRILFLEALKKLSFHKSIDLYLGAVIGGYHLEHFYSSGLVEYRLIVFQKSDLF